MKWIPINIRLPKEKVEVLVLTEDGKISIDYILSFPKEDPPFVWSRLSDEVNVRYWMPLPDPILPKGEE